MLTCLFVISVFLPFLSLDLDLDEPELELDEEEDDEDEEDERERRPPPRLRSRLRSRLPPRSRPRERERERRLAASFPVRRFPPARSRLREREREEDELEDDLRRFGILFSYGVKGRKIELTLRTSGFFLPSICRMLRCLLCWLCLAFLSVTVLEFSRNLPILHEKSPFLRHIWSNAFQILLDPCGTDSMGF